MVELIHITHAFKIDLEVYINIIINYLSTNDILNCNNITNDILNCNICTDGIR